MFDKVYSLLITQYLQLQRFNTLTLTDKNKDNFWPHNFDAMNILRADRYENREEKEEEGDSVQHPTPILKQDSKPHMVSNLDKFKLLQQLHLK